MNFFNTDALSGACAGSLLEKIPYAEKKNQECGIRSLDPYLVKLKRYHLRYSDRYRHLITSKSKYIEKIIKIEIANNSNIWKASYRKESAANLLSFQCMFISHFEVRNWPRM